MKNYKVICKKNFRLNFPSGTFVNFKEGCSYTMVVCEISPSIPWICFVRCENHNNYSFFKENIYGDLFDDYFCTLKEYRKIKLNKIKNHD
jgi:hypothetical protein